ncbi:MAG: hypothetical protein GF390_01780 [Candidatus Pacebacteria bacterium]|nr:hypothetical protein [Candidatus Paceibacterota bacterium]
MVIKIFDRTRSSKNRPAELPSLEDRQVLISPQLNEEEKVLVKAFYQYQQDFFRQLHQDNTMFSDVWTELQKRKDRIIDLPTLALQSFGAALEFTRPSEIDENALDPQTFFAEGGRCMDAAYFTAAVIHRLYDLANCDFPGYTQLLLCRTQVKNVSTGEKKSSYHAVVLLADEREQIILDTLNAKKNLTCRFYAAKRL